MTGQAEREVKAFIVSLVRERLLASGFDLRHIPDDFDLRGHGVIDSLGFIQLLLALETLFGQPMDLADLAPEQLTNLTVLSQHIAAQILTRQVLA